MRLDKPGHLAEEYEKQSERERFDAIESENRANADHLTDFESPIYNVSSSVARPVQRCTGVAVRGRSGEFRCPT